MKEETPVTPSIEHLVFRKGAQGESAQDKGPGIERDFLLAPFSLFADEHNGVELLYTPSCKADCWQD